MPMFSIFNDRNDSRGKTPMEDNVKDGQTVIVDIEGDDSQKQADEAQKPRRHWFSSNDPNVPTKVVCDDDGTPTPMPAAGQDTRASDGDDAAASLDHDFDVSDEEEAFEQLDEAIDESDKPTYEELSDALADMRAENERLFRHQEETKRDWQNFKRRTAEEHERMVAESGVKVAKELLPIMDALERSIEHSRSYGEAGAALADGNQAIYTQMLKVLNAEGIEQMNPIGEKFDPRAHQAIANVPGTEYQAGTVCTVHQRGYKCGDKVVRNAIVSVSC